MLVLFAGFGGAACAATLALPLWRQARHMGLGFGWGLFVVAWGLFGDLLYHMPPSFTGPALGLEWLLLLLGIYTLVLGNDFEEIDRGYKTSIKVRPRTEAYVAGVLLLLLLGMATAGWPVLRTHRYAALIGEVKEASNGGEIFVPTDIQHIRAVSPEQAEWAGNKVLGEKEGSLGSRFKPGDYSIQLVDNKLVWVSALDFLGLGSWQSSTDGTPGYIRVSAEDPLEKPELVTAVDGKPIRMRYTPEAYFGYNLRRHVWSSGYATYVIADWHLELDDSHRPFWVVSLTRPTISFFGEKVVKVLVVDPDSGEIQPFAVDDVPAWVDRVIPEYVATANIQSWGYYSQGWVSAFWSGVGTKQPTVTNIDTDETKETCWLIYAKDGRAHWFTGMTSLSNTDQALVSVVTMDSRTGQAYEYRMAGSNEEAVLAAANSAVSNYEGWHATQPILYRLTGDLVWVVPILSEQHIYQKLAIVRASNAQVALSDTKAGAVSALKNLLARSGGDSISPAERAQVTKVHITVRRIGDDFVSGNLIRNIIAEEYPGKVFTIQSSISPRVPLIREGDELILKVSVSDDEAIPVSGIEFVEPAPVAR